MDRFYIRLNEDRIEQHFNRYVNCIKTGNNLLRELKKQYRDKFVTFRFSLLLEFFNGTPSSSPERFFDFLYEKAKAENDIWRSRAKELGIEITSSSFPVRYFSEGIVDLITKFTEAVSVDAQYRLERQYLKMDENGNGILEEDDLKEYLKTIHGTSLDTPEEMDIWRKCQAAAALLQDVMGEILSKTHPKDRPHNTNGTELKILDLEDIFQVNWIDGKIEASPRCIPRLRSISRDLFVVSNQESRAQAYEENSRLHSVPQRRVLDPNFSQTEDGSIRV